MKDIVFPKNNEKEFIAMAMRLGFNEIVFVYSNVKDVKRVDGGKVKVRYGVMGDKKGFLSVMKADDKVRGVLEQIKPDYLYGLEILEYGDSFHYRKSGLNQVLAKIMAKNNTKLLIPLGEIRKHSGVKKVRFLGRIMQNIRICRKYRVGMKIVSFATSPYQMKSVKEMGSFGTVLGMDSMQVKKSLE